MSSGKSRKQETEVKLPKSLERAAEQGLALANDVAMLPYVPNFGLTTAAFTPTQEAAFQGMNDTASAFGMPTSSGTGLPQAQSAGGFSGYSTRDLYNNSMQNMDPEVLRTYQQFLANPFGSQLAENAGRSGGSGGGGRGSVSGTSGKSSGNGILGSAFGAAQNAR